MAALGAEAGGLAGHSIGARWGRKLADWPGPPMGAATESPRQGGDDLSETGNAWRLFTSIMVSGILEMKHYQFVVWNLAVGAVYVLPVGPPPTARARFRPTGRIGAAWTQ